MRFYYYCTVLRIVCPAVTGLAGHPHPPIVSARTHPGLRRPLSLANPVCFCNSQRHTASRAVTAETKSSELFAEPLAREGAGSVFPVDLPMAKR